MAATDDFQRISGDARWQQVLAVVMGLDLGLMGLKGTWRFQPLLHRVVTG
jgi:hypothetical protein